MKFLYQKFCVVLLLLCFAFNAKAQWIAIPDTFFGKWLKAKGYNQCLQGNSTIGWQMDTTCSAVLGTITIDCSSSSIKNLTGVKYFRNLDTLICSYSHIDTLFELPPSLVCLSCWNGQLKYIATLPSTLKILSLEHNQIKALPTLPDSLVNLNFYDNQVSSLPLLPNSIKYLRCCMNPIHTLPQLPNNMLRLYCNFNMLTSLPPLPDSLIEFDCDHNQLTTLPLLPSNLRLLDCYNNQFSYLPALPYFLNYLNCDSNEISSLPALPDSLTQLRCSGNQLTCLPSLPDSLSILFCNNNPNLHHLPKLGRVVDLRFDSASVSCALDYGNVSVSSPSLSSISICDSTVQNICSVSNNIWDVINVRFSLFPNPATNEITITAADDFNSAETISIYDLMGKYVRSFQSVPVNSFSVKTEELSNGIYFLKISSGGVTGTKKFIIAR
jgi:hypothetical protein